MLTIVGELQFVFSYLVVDPLHWVRTEQLRFLVLTSQYFHVLRAWSRALLWWYTNTLLINTIYSDLEVMDAPHLNAIFSTGRWASPLYASQFQTHQFTRHPRTQILLRHQYDRVPTSTLHPTPHRKPMTVPHFGPQTLLPQYTLPARDLPLSVNSRGIRWCGNALTRPSLS